MLQPDLVVISITAFAAVFLLLTLLAVVMHLITISFPGKAVPGPAERPTDAAAPGPPRGGIDTAGIAAIHAAYQRIFPGRRITRIEEISG